jgi:hypothetical protein
MIAEGLAQSMGRHPYAEIQLGSDALKDSVERPVSHRSVCAGLAGRLRAEHIVAQMNTGRMLKVKRYGLDNGGVDSYIPILLASAGVAGLLFKYREAIAEDELIGYKVGEPKNLKVADAKSEVYANNEEHIIPISAMGDEVLGYSGYIIQTLNGLGGMFVESLVVVVLYSGGDETRV